MTIARDPGLACGVVADGAICYPGWAVVEWECCLKHPEDGAREGVQFVTDRTSS